MMLAMNIYSDVPPVQYGFMDVMDSEKVDL